MVKRFYGSHFPIIAAVFLIAQIGCGQSSSISGKVTFDGDPVAKGSISFQPADGKGPSSGGEILNGNYAVDDIQPGTKVVQIVGVKQAQSVPRTSDEVANQSNQPESSQLIPANSSGNNQEFTVTSGEQTKDFALTSEPPRGEGK
jgi:hypothetical protein